MPPAASASRFACWPAKTTAARNDANFVALITGEEKIGATKEGLVKL